MFGETLRVEAHRPDALCIRARLGLTVVEPHVNALLSPAPAPASADIVVDGTRERLTNVRIRAELRDVPRHGADLPKEVVIRYGDTATDKELLAETRSSFAGPRAFKPIASPCRGE